MCTINNNLNLHNLYVIQYMLQFLQYRGKGLISEVKVPVHEFGMPKRRGGGLFLDEHVAEYNND